MRRFCLGLGPGMIDVQKARIQSPDFIEQVEEASKAIESELQELQDATYVDPERLNDIYRAPSLVGA